MADATVSEESNAESPKTFISADDTLETCAASGTSPAAPPPPPCPSPAQAWTTGQLRRLNVLAEKFRDFDDKAEYERVKELFRHEDAKNFVVHFGKDAARVACDLEAGDFDTLMAKRSIFGAEQLPVRWINIWNPSEQKGAIDAIGRHYGFSQRLMLSIWAWDKVKEGIHASARAAKTRPSSKYMLDGVVSMRAKPGPDLESGTNGSPVSNKYSHVSVVGGSASDSFTELDGVLDQENKDTFAMMQNTIDYTSIDMGSRFICFGANWLHKPPGNFKNLVPPKHWSWFALCDDGTIISIHESYQRSFSKKDAEINPNWQAEELRNIRANTLRVFRQLSKQGEGEDRNKIMQLTSVRESMSPDDSTGREGASNIFYYLFEDYSAAILILRNAKGALEDISRRVLKTAEWRHRENTADIIPQLYKLNKELRQLRHLFKNYDTLISKIITRDLDEASDAAHPERPAAAWLSNGALNRFRRLKVQLQSLMLDTIRDYLDEKESLQTTYFNLTNQKDSQATERLTRSATALAKLSVFFLPISFMTSYFSVQIPDLTDSLTKWSYWGAFAVIAGVSFIGIFFFSKVLMFLSDWLDHVAEQVEHWIKEKTCWKRLTCRKKKEEEE